LEQQRPIAALVSLTDRTLQVTVSNATERELETKEKVNFYVEF